MQLYSQHMETKCILTLSNPKIPENIRSMMLGKLSKEFFHYPPCVAAFDRISAIARKRFEMVEYADLLEDPAMEEEFRDILRDTDIKCCKNKKAINKVVDTLDAYRQIRIIYDGCSEALDKLEGEKVDNDALMDNLADKITRARRSVEDEHKIVNIGANHSNADDVVENVLYKVEDELYKTGFTAYDERNGGLPKEGVMILAATTSGGKSTVLMNILVKLYLICKLKVFRVSLEMGDEQEMERLLSHLSGVPFWRIKQGKLRPKDRERIKTKYDEFKKFGEENGCTFSSMSPVRGVTFDDALRTVKPYSPHVIGVDYVNLLEGVDDENQWRKLSGIVREAKIFSRETKSLVIILCQLDSDSDKIRYSRGMKEHADIVWIWNYSKKEQRELNVLPINVDKVRDGEVFSFDLSERFDIMTVENMESDGSNAYDSDDPSDEPDSPDSDDEDDTYALS